MVERRLGRGLDFFLSGGRSQGRAATDSKAAPDRDEVQMIDVGALIPNPDQPRREFHEGELADLAASIRSAGLLQPILVRRVGGQMQIIAGERRWRAARAAGLERVPALIRDVTDTQSAVFSLVENLHREDLNPIEKARAFARLIELTKSNQEEVGRQVGLDRSSVANFMRLLELPADVQAHVSRGTLSMGQARALLGLPDAKTRSEIADRIVRDRMSVRQVEALVKQLKDATPKAPTGGAAKARQPDKELWVKEIEDNLAAALDTSVSVRYSNRHSKIVIDCEGRAEFERVYERLLGRKG